MHDGVIEVQFDCMLIRLSSVGGGEVLIVNPSWCWMWYLVHIYNIVGTPSGQKSSSRRFHGGRVVRRRARIHGALSLLVCRCVVDRRSALKWWMWLAVYVFMTGFEDRKVNKRIHRCNQRRSRIHCKTG